MNFLRLYQQLKNVYHFCQAHFWRLWYGRPDAAMHLYGVTGTNGKTTTSYVLAHILAAAHGRPQVGMLTTVAFWIGETEIFNETKLTTLPSQLVFRYLAEMRKRGVKHVVVEVTSHALDQHRLASITLDGAIVLNIAREHLDYHRTMAGYAAAKARIINYVRPEGTLVGKTDDALVGPIMIAAKEQGIKTRSFTRATAAKVITPLPGDVNKENVLAASLLAEAVGVPASAIAAGVAACRAVPGRMQWIDLATGARALIDYAVTPDALERLYQSVRRETQGKIYAVLGAAGNRDRGKRPDMARVVAQYADELVITREDPWTESEEQIFNDLEKGLRDTTTTWQRIVDRTEALRYCVQHVQPEDVIVATGKGAERGMGIGKQVVPWDEAGILRQLGQARGTWPS